METYGFVYLWFDRKHKRYYVGSHWGLEKDKYVCSSNWMRSAHKRRPQDFKRRILERVFTSRSDLLDIEQKWLDMIKPSEIKVRYYNLNLNTQKYWHTFPESKRSIGEKIAASKRGKKRPPMSEEQKLKISLANKGRPKTEEEKAKISLKMTGIKRSEETKARMRQSKLRRTTNSVNKP